MTAYDFIFTKKSPAKYYRHIIFWVAQFFFWTFWTTGFFLGLVQLLKSGLRFNGALILHAVYTYLIVYYFSPKYLETKNYKKFTLSVFTASLVCYILYVFYFINFFYGVHNYFEEFKQNSNHQQLLVTWYFSMNFIIEGPPVVCAMFLCCKMLKNYYIKMDEKQMLVKENAQAEMQILKAQVQPHFLFNTLNNIYSFTLNKSPKAKELVSNLYEIMKYMVDDCNVELIELSKDLKMVQDYIELEKVRYGKRLDITIHIDGRYQNKLVTPLLIIPFVENAFKHGTSKMLKDPWIKLSIQVDEAVLHFTLANSKPANEIVNGNHGIGLNNVKKRLELLYPQNHLLVVESTENTFTVNMQIPLYNMQEKIVA